MRKVAVVFGGRSCENEISVLTGVFVLNLIDKTKFVPIPIYIHTDGGMYTSSKMMDIAVFRDKRYAQFNRVFLDGGVLYAFGGGKKIKRICKIDAGINCCHGGLGEGGGISAIMEWNEIPFASPDITSSSVFMDKCTTKMIMRALNIPTVDYIRVNEADYKKRGAFLLKSIYSRLKYPVVVKPAHLGSSIGISVAKTEDEAKTAIENAFLIDDRVLIEKYLEDKKDVNCAVYSLNGEIFVSEPETAFLDGFYSFEEKYIHRKSDGERQDLSVKGGGRYELKGELREKIRSYTKTVYKRMNMRGVVRMDFLVSEGKAYLCEVNTVPGSLAYYLFCERISDARTFFSDLIEDAIKEFALKDKKIISTGILSEVKASYRK